MLMSNFIVFILLLFMKNRLLSALLLLLASVPLISTQQLTKKLVCYYASWSIYVPGNGFFNISNPSHFNPNLCTHMMYAFVGVDKTAKLLTLDTYADITQGGYAKVNQLKLKNPALKTLFSLGGGETKYSPIFSTIAASATLRQTLVNNAFNFVKKYNYSGIDIDWEYPAQNGGKPVDKQNFALLLREMSAKFKPANLLVTAAVSAYIPYLATSYDIPAVNSYLDLVLMMNYDYHGSWDTKTGPTAPLYAAPNDADQTLNANASIQHWLKAGVSRSKLVMGIPLYGCSFTLANTANNGVNALISGPGSPGSYTQTNGTLHYNEICENLKAGGWTVVMHPQQKVPYAFKGDQWVGYDNPTSVQTKANYIKANNLTGSMVWVLHGDDFLNRCGNGSYPLINMLRNTQG